MLGHDDLKAHGESVSDEFGEHLRHGDLLVEVVVGEAVLFADLLEYKLIRARAHETFGHCCLGRIVVRGQRHRRRYGHGLPSHA